MNTKGHQSFTYLNVDLSKNIFTVTNILFCAKSKSSIVEYDSAKNEVNDCALNESLVRPGLDNQIPKTCLCCGLNGAHSIK